jgi:hypothetical protein
LKLVTQEPVRSEKPSEDSAIADQKAVRQWREGHAAIFFVFMCLLVSVLGVAMFNGLDLLKAVGQAVPQTTTKSK